MPIFTGLTALGRILLPMLRTLRRYVALALSAHALTDGMVTVETMRHELRNGSVLVRSPAVALDAPSLIGPRGTGMTNNPRDVDMMGKCRAARMVGAFGFCCGMRTGAGIYGTIGLGAL